MNKREVSISVSVNSACKGSLHTLRELTDIALTTEQANDFVEGVVKDVAPHYHALAAEVEFNVRKDKTGTDAEIAEDVHDIFTSQLKDELKYLISEHDWDGTRLPAAAYRATQSILGALETGGSLQKLNTVSQCEKYAKDVRKAARAAKKEAYDLKNSKPGTGSPAPANDGTVPAHDDMVGRDTNLTEEQNQQLAKLVAKLCEAYKANPSFTSTLAGHCIKKADNIIDNSKASMAKRVANA